MKVQDYIKSILLISIVLFSNVVQAQQSCNVGGRLLDSLTNKPMPFADLQLKNEDNRIVCSGLSDEDGCFSLSALPGLYCLEVYSLGRLLFVDKINLDSNRDLGILKLHDPVFTIGEVVVNGVSKRVIEQKPDRLIYNISDSPFSDGYNVREAISYLPRLDVTDNSISIIGKSNVQVMIDGRLLRIPTQEIMTYLQTLQTSQIEKIEIITVPPAKYDASGNSGLINIVLKRDRSLGFNGFTVANYIQRTNAGGDVTAGFNYNSKKIHWRGSISGIYDARRFTTSTEYDFSTNARRLDNTLRPTVGKDITASVGIGYDLSERSEINVVYNYSRWKNRENSDTDIAFLSSADEIYETYEAQSDESMSYHYHTVGGFYDLELTDNGSRMSLYADYLTKSYDTDNATLTTGESSDSNLNSHMKAGYNVWSCGADFSIPCGIVEIETGLKYSSVDNSSDQYIVANATPSSDIFHYSEHIYAAYTSIEAEISDHWTLQGGLRYEYTRTRGSSVIWDNSHNRKYGDLFPTAYLQYAPNDKHNLVLAYDRRIERPGFYNINPYVKYITSYSYSMGNPSLMPVLSDDVELTYTYSNRLVLSAFYNHIKDGVTDFTLPVEGTDEMYSQPFNGYTQHNIGLYATYYYTLANWWSGQISATGYYCYNSILSPITHITSNDTWSCSFSTNNNFFLNKKRNIILLLSYKHSLPTTEGITYVYGRAGLDVGVRIGLLDNRLLLTLSGQDLFKQQLNRYKERYSEYSIRGYNYSDMRCFRMSLTYKFGDGKRNKSRTIEDEQKDRM